MSNKYNDRQTNGRWTNRQTNGRWTYRCTLNMEETDTQTSGKWHITETHCVVGKSNMTYTETVHILCWPKIADQCVWNLFNRGVSTYVRKHLEYIPKYKSLHHESQVTVFSSSVKSYMSMVYKELTPYKHLQESYHQIKLKIFLKEATSPVDDTLIFKETSLSVNDKSLKSQTGNKSKTTTDQNSKLKDEKQRKLNNKKSNEGCFTEFDISLENDSFLSPIPSASKADASPSPIPSENEVETPYKCPTSTPIKSHNDLQIFNSDVFYTDYNKEDNSSLSQGFMDGVNVSWGSFYEISSDSITSDEVTVYQPVETFKTEVLILPRKKGKFGRKKQKYDGILKRKE